MSRAPAAGTSGRAFTPIPAMAPAPASLFEVRRKPADAGAFEVAPRAAFTASLARLPATPAQPAVQRKCAACEAEDKKIRRQVDPKEDEEDKVRRQVEPEEDEDELATAVQPSLEVGPAGDHYEREADAIAAHVMAMPAGGAVATSGARPSVQRACAACAAEDKIIRREMATKEDEEEEVRARPAEPAPGTSIPASAGQLTGGGRPLPDATRSFFEERMGRDLSAVRVHEGDQAGALNHSIRARAFTYSNHVWLGPGERGAPGFTMAHELAHVLQQTQPRALARSASSASAAPAGVRGARRARLAPPEPQEAYWEPYELNGTATHNKLLPLFVEQSANSDLFVEAPIPNANLDGAAAGKKGVADFYRAERTIGVYFGNDNVPKGLGVVKSRFRAGKSGYEHNLHAAPIARPVQEVERITEGPSYVRIGDLKPAPNTLPAQKGPEQIMNYIRGVEWAQSETNDWVARHSRRFDPGGAPAWKLSGGISPGSPAAVPPATAVREALPDQAIVLKQFQESNERGRAATRVVYRPRPNLIGRITVREDPGRPGIVNYYWKPVVPKGQGLPPDVRENVEIVDGFLIPRLRGDQTGRARPLRLGSPRVQRAKALKEPRKPPPLFAHKEWEAKRQKVALGWRKSKASGTAASALTEFYIFEVDKALGPAGDNLYHDPTRTAQAGRAKAIRKLEFFSSAKGKAVGYMRRLFGKAFIAGHNALQRMKRLFTRDKRLRPAGTATGLASAALSALIRVLVIVGGVMIQRTAQIVSDAIGSCAEQRLKAIFDLAEIDQVEAQVRQLEVGGLTLDQISEMEESEVARRFLGEDFADLVVNLEDGQIADKLFGPYKGTIDTLIAGLNTANVIKDVISIVQWAIRVVACLSPPALGCLWILAEAALSWAFSMFISSCWFLKKVAPKIHEVPTVSSLSEDFAGKILQGIGGVVPKSILGDCDLQVARREAAAEGPDLSAVDEACDSSGRQPTAAELELAEMLESVSTSKLDLLKKWAATHGWGAGTEIDLAKAADFIQVLNSKSVEEIEEMLKRSDTGGGAVEAVANFKEAAERGAKKPSAAEGAEESAKRKAGAGGAGTGTGGKSTREGEGGAEKGKEAGAGVGRQIIVTRPKGVPSDWKPSSMSEYGIVILSGLPSASGFKAGKVHAVDARLTIEGAIVKMLGLRLVVYERSETRDEGGGRRTTYLVSPTEDVYIAELDYTLSGGEASKFEYYEPGK